MNFNNIKLIFEIIHQSLINDNTVRLMNGLIKDEEIKSESLNTFDVGIRGNISENVLLEFLNVLIDKFPEKGSLIAINSIFFYYEVYRTQNIEKRLPKEFVQKLVLMPVFWEHPELLYHKEQPLFHDYNTYWKNTLFKLLSENPDMVNDIIDKIIKTIQNSDDLFRQKEDLEEIFEHIIELNSDVVWEKLKDLLTGDNEKTAVLLLFWLSGRFKNKSPMLKIDTEKIWKWIDENKTERAILFANYIPSDLFHSETNPCFACQFIMRYGDIKEVRDNFSMNFSNSRGVVIGSYSNRLLLEKQKLIEYLKNEDNERIKLWVKEYIQNYLNADIEEFEIFEEEHF